MPVILVNKPNHKSEETQAHVSEKPKKENKNPAIISFSPLTVPLSLSLSLRPNLAQEALHTLCFLFAYYA
jgi:hypothetical protein